MGSIATVDRPQIAAFSSRFLRAGLFQHKGTKTQGAGASSLCLGAFVLKHMKAA